MSEEVTEVKEKKTRKRKASAVAGLAAVCRPEVNIPELIEKRKIEQVDWRQYISPEHIILNKNEMAKIGVDINLLTEEEKQKHLAAVGNDKKVILLAGFRELAALRGYSSVVHDVTFNGDVAVATCKITFLPFGSSWEQTYQTVATASPKDVSPTFSNFCAAIACNRAFCRCVREFLRISIVSDEELNPQEEVSVKNNPKPLQLVKERCAAKGISFETLKKSLEGRGHALDTVVSFEGLPIGAVLDALEAIQGL